MFGFTVGFIVGVALTYIGHRSYLRTLEMIGENGGSEHINGKWYRITKEESQ
jgi:hypothetical protein